ncbi:RagB/SusD family nutrient uptake outer membrane protein [Parapedobacter sp. 10938]|uniref:RagB/SusD family nutrient uptake outer membrane protein n=1 Tax=Parapedobacter flavus TaxID=3110225 RepID=UPI002DBCA1F2|nr:RagB/SusD family nutrient uptake outer membrane protein [Parapedobacter sp. 10938]MEC3878170.1 RagB/SusD family nutrient uptake outer membrane protein [Parapedobacter sp. 10938]
MKKIIVYTYGVFLTLFGGCQKYLDIVPDNIATIENAFNMRVSAERFLYSCYHYLPLLSNIEHNPAFTAGDEFWLHEFYRMPGWEIARGFQNVTNPYLNYWQGNTGQGSNATRDLYQAIRDCNIFLENVDAVPDLSEGEKRRWVAEVKFLKAYFHFYLIRMYGPIPLKKENLPIDAGVEEVKVFRDPVDECFAYVVELLDEALPDLPAIINSQTSELGRITQPIALSVKAHALVTAASPLFNGNPDYAHFTDKRGTQLFNPDFSMEKWEQAKQACEAAIAACEDAGNRLYYYSQSGLQYDVSPEIRTEMNIRNAVTEKWNDEIIWGHTNSMTGNMQRQSTPRGVDPATRANSNVHGNAAVPLKIAAQFYTKNGVPIEEDLNWDYNARFDLHTGTEAEKYHIKEGYTTARFNVDREPRYYANLGFDGGIWYGMDRFDDDETWFVSAKKGEPASNVARDKFNVTGIWGKKLVNYQNSIGETSYTIEQYPWPVYRLANIYLLYAEALNEMDGPSPEVFEFLDLIRERAGLPGVEAAWQLHSRNPNKPQTKEGLREIIHQERLIELALEGQRFWDLRRWKKAMDLLNAPITGWDIEQRTAEGYYRERVLYNQTFAIRDYLWPVRENELLANKNTIQNPGW